MKRLTLGTGESVRVLASSGSSVLEHIPPDTARTIAYLRVSTEDQAADDRASLPEQQQQCEAFAATLDRTVDYVWSDAGVSGRDVARLERLTTWCEAHQRPRTDRGLIVVLKRDRWARFTHDDNASAYYEYRLSQAGWDTDFVLEPKTKNKTADAVIATIHRRMASEESEERGRRALVGMTAQARLGYSLGRPAFGFAREVINTSTGKTRHLGPGEHGADGERSKLVPGPAADVRTVRRIFEWAAEGMTYDDIAARLNAAKAPGPWLRYPNRRTRADGNRGPDGWTGFGQIYRILKNPAYIGVLRWWPRCDDGETRVKDPIVVEAAHEALIDRALFEKVQLRFKTKRTRVATAGRYLLTGTLKCICGAEFRGGGGQRRYVVAREGTHIQIGPKRSGAFRRAKAGERGTYVEVTDFERFQFYKCPTCREPRRVTINKRWMEGRVIELVSAHVKQVLKSGTFDQVLDEIMAEQSGQRRKGRKDVDTERAELRQELDRLVQAVAHGGLKPEEVKPLADALRTSLEELEHDRQRGKFEERGAMLSAKERARLKMMARDFSARIKRADIVTARQMIAAWVSELTVDGRNPRKRTGRLVLRAVPIVGFAHSTSVLPERERRCSREGCRRFFPRLPRRKLWK